MRARRCSGQPAAELSRWAAPGLAVVVPPLVEEAWRVSDYASQPPRGEVSDRRLSGRCWRPGRRPLQWQPATSAPRSWRRPQVEGRRIASTHRAMGTWSLGNEGLCVAWPKAPSLITSRYNTIIQSAYCTAVARLPGRGPAAAGGGRGSKHAGRWRRDAAARSCRQRQPVHRPGPAAGALMFLVPVPLVRPLRPSHTSGTTTYRRGRCIHGQLRGLLPRPQCRQL